MTQIFELFGEYGLAWVVAILAVAVGLPKVVKYFDRMREKYVDQMQQMNDRFIANIQENNEKFDTKFREREIIFLKELREKDQRIIRVTDQTFEAIHDFREVLRQTTDIVSDMRGDIKPYKEVEPIIRQMVKNVDTLTTIMVKERKKEN